MCGGDDHLAWKRPVSSEACRGLRTAGGSDPVFPLFSLQLRVLGDRAFRSHFLARHTFTLLSLTRYFGICSLIIFLHCTPITGSVPHSLFDPWFDFQLDAHIFITERFTVSFDWLAYRFCGFDSGGIDQFELEDGYSANASYTDVAYSHDHAAVIPPLSHQLPLLRILFSYVWTDSSRIRQMRDPDEMISWDDPDDVPVATLPVGFRMPDIERYTGLDVLRHDTEMVRFIRVISSENLGGLSTGVSETVFLQWEKAAEMIERPTERSDEHMMAYLEDYGQILFLLDTEGREVGGSSESYGDHRHPHSVQQYPSVHPHTVTVRPSFQFQRPQTSIPRHEQSRPHRRRQRTYSDLGMPLDRAFERLRSTGHRTDYCASLRHTIQDLIDSGAVSFPISTTDTDLGPDMTADSFPVYSTHAVPPPSGLYHHVLDTQGTDIHRTL
ncbi:hypothetical protein CK203_049478 [Vitis vinifera]|uniref:Uncharacterized protein n=1 Tax=Vitis vinifera TaxID=29760 RepID=A0A438HAT7_VITVI|nr:hypothetical protein CK203_049478 [Vitis vinifera]